MNHLKRIFTGLIVGLVFLATPVSMFAASYTVRSGDWLSSIGARHGVSWQTLCAHNRLANCHLIFTGQVIDIPTAQAPQAPVAAPAAPQRLAQPSGPDAWDGLLQQHFGASWQIAKKVMMGESSGNPNAVGDRNTAYASYGLFQIRALPGRPAPAQLLDPAFNVQYAAGMWRTQGWCPWTVAKKLGYCR